LKTFYHAAMAALALASSAQAQDDRALHQYSPLVLLTPAGARTLAMGSTGIGGRDDDVLFFNPAQIVIARGFSASVERYTPWSSGGSMSAVTRFNTGGIAIGARMVDYQTSANVYETTRTAMSQPGVGRASSMEASVGIAQVLKGFRVGGVIKYAENTAPVVRVGAPAVDFGISKDFFGPYTFGLAVQNIGPSMDIACDIATVPAVGRLAACTGPTPPGGFSPGFLRTESRLPLRTTLGVQTQRSVGEFDLVATAAVSALRLGWIGGSGGAELGYSWLEGYGIALRAGARRPLPGEAAMTAGAGFNMDRLSFDYAIESLSGSRFGHRFGLRVR
jgi:hypothetical protein